MRLARVPAVLLTFGLLATLPAAEAQQAGKIPRVGFVEAGSRSANQHFADAFRAGLHELGYLEGQSITVEERWAEGKIERFPDLLADLLRLKVDVIVQASGQGAVAAKKAHDDRPGRVRGRERSRGTRPRREPRPAGRQRYGIVSCSHGRVCREMGRALHGSRAASIPRGGPLEPSFEQREPPMG